MLLLFFAVSLYTKSSVVLAVLRKFFDGTSVKEEGEEARDNNVSSTALFSKLGKMAMYLLVCYKAQADWETCFV